MIAPRTLLLLPLLLLSGACGPEEGTASVAASQAAPDEAPRPERPPVTGTAQFDLLTFSKLQGRAEAIPCNPDAIAPLAAGARRRAAVEAESDGPVRLVCVGDALQATVTITANRAARVGAQARSEVILDAMAAAGVDLYVPSYGDFGNLGVEPLLDACRERGLRVLLTNLDAPGRDDVLPHVILEHAGTRIALLGAIPKEPARGKEPLEAQGYSVAAPVRRLRNVASELLESGRAEIIVVLSALPARITQKLCDEPGLHFIIGTTDRGQAAGRIVHRHNSWMMNQEFNGHELGHTTVRIVNGDYRMADLSGLWYLPEQIAAEEAALDLYEAEYGTRDLSVLARHLMPGFESEFMDRYRLLEENRVWLRDYADYAGSYVAHRVEPYDADPPGDPVVVALDRTAEAIRQAVAADLKNPPKEVDPFSHVPTPESCQECHAAQYDHWTDTGHARSYDLLVDVGRELDTSCLVCHAAGYAKPGGYQDPRLAAPFGGYTCWNCHATQSYHAEILRGATDPAFIGFTDVEPMKQYCQNCHDDQRSPGFDLEAALDRVTCPPMRLDDPTLALVRGKVLNAIERHREAGTDEPRDRYREGRALVGLGRVEEGIAALEQYLGAMSLGDEAYVHQHVEVARFLDELERSHEAVALLRALVGDAPGDPVANHAYISMLLDATDPTARDPGYANTYLGMVAPLEEGHKFEPEELDMRLLQVRAFFESGNQQMGFQLLQLLDKTFPRNEKVQEHMERYLAGPPR